jgi:hypothetical protein
MSRPTHTPSPTPQALAYRKWYQKNREEFNRKRAEAYAADPEKRAAAQVKQKIYRDTKPRNPEPGQHFRLIKSQHVEVFRIGTVAEMIGRDEQTIRSWERKGYIPKPIVKSAHRFYTTKQVALMQEFGEISTAVRWKRKLSAIALPKKIKEIKALWAGV